ncbi:MULTISPECIES: stress-induced protein YchH [unclassified Brenneria]|uniref:stress-induced protein YchH n=1 Tax=unclassified Brenneria TaxID=2634434 RepID=UPI001551A505|nr:stress-induced protein YchH [Brenneria sp. hezel4-2-4]MEE3649229.1 stress-induced protein YchH [Brenneria sp. HEZEL_4_2_4]NPC99182.1 stress-induced protein YchH [Brenneria sp. hezel4-2-4]
MKRKSATTLGNVLMGIGMVLMIGGIGYSIISQFPELNLPQYMTYVDLVAIFAGAISWLVGARISGREKVADRYWWVKHFDKRCRREHHS